MHKFICTHTLPPGALTPEQICQVSEAAQHETNVKGYRSFFNLTKGKVWCVLEAKDRDSIVAWFKKMEIPYDSIDLVEMEGERGTIEDLTQTLTLAGVS
jgi:hypothetical protein